jgi:2'-5' RNA ligase
VKKTLYVCRPVINAGSLIRWAEKQGFKQTLKPADMHVTLAFSRAKLDWPKAVATPLYISRPEGLKREVKPLGDKGAVVLAFDSSTLYRRWRQFINEGASWDYATFAPHITITYDGGGMDLSEVEPFNGEIELGGEKFAELDEDWDEKITERKSA